MLNCVRYFGVPGPAFDDEHKVALQKEVDKLSYMEDCGQQLDSYSRLSHGRPSMLRRRMNHSKLK